MRYSSMSPNSSSAAESLGAPTRTPRSVFAFSAETASRRSPSTLIVFCHGKSLREPDTTYFAFASSFCAHSRIARGAFSWRAQQEEEWRKFWYVDPVEYERGRQQFAEQANRTIG